MSHEVPDVLSEERVRHFNQFSEELTHASHQLPHLDPVVDALHHTLRTACRDVTTRLGLMSMDLRVQATDDGELVFDMRDRRCAIRNNHLSMGNVYSPQAPSTVPQRPILRVIARKSSLLTRLRRLRYRKQANLAAIMQYLMDVETNNMQQPMVCDEQRRLPATLFKELLRHGYLPESVQAFHSEDARAGDNPLLRPDSYQVKMSHRNSEVYFRFRPVGLFELSNIPEVNYYREPRQFATG